MPSFYTLYHVVSCLHSLEAEPFLPRPSKWSRTLRARRHVDHTAKIQDTEFVEYFDALAMAADESESRCIGREEAEKILRLKGIHERAVREKERCFPLVLRYTIFLFSTASPPPVPYSSSFLH